ncbi:MAG TPA: hypothetical protein PKC97_16175 [Burkholderiaceae bacterium]|nr:hypothetical protein [Burkholderiaceae bacterium]
MKTRFVSALLAGALTAIGPGTAAFAQGQPIRIGPMPGQFPEEPIRLENLRDFLDYLGKEKLPFGITIEMTLRCLGGLCGGGIKPSSIPVQQTQTLPCQDLSGDERIKCLEAFIRANAMLR